MTTTATAKFPAFRLHRNAIVRVDRRRYRVMAIDLVARIPRRGQARRDPLLRIRLLPVSGYGQSKTVDFEQCDLVTIEVSK